MAFLLVSMVSYAQHGERHNNDALLQGVAPHWLPGTWPVVECKPEVYHVVKKGVLHTVATVSSKVQASYDRLPSSQEIDRRVSDPKKNGEEQTKAGNNQGQGHG